MEKKLIIVIADDHPIFRRGLGAMIESEASLTLAAEADNGETALALICEHEPDVAILDLDMPQKDGFAVTQAIRQKNLATDVIFLTMHKNEGIFNAALDLGVKGFVLKDSALPEIIDCIKAVRRGQHYISPPLSTYLINRRNRFEALSEEKNGLKSLTPAERNILKIIADGKMSREIAETLFISIRTVDRHRANISQKLNLRGTNALVKFAIAHKSDI
jgi:DNA-binding NarL/FixJ family response regulator